MQKEINGREIKTLQQGEKYAKGEICGLKEKAFRH